MDKINFISQEAHLQAIDNIGTAWMHLIGSAIHELRSSAALLQMGQKHIRAVFSEMLVGYQLALQQHLEVPELSEKKLSSAKKEISSDGMEREIAQFSQFLNDLRDYTRKLFFPASDIKIYHISLIINDTIAQYPFAIAEKLGKIQLNIYHNFTYSCPLVFVKALLFNLLSNSFRYIEKAGKGNIFIWTEETKKYYSLHVKDTAGGMNENMLPKVFNRFFSNQNNKIQPGLGFCRLALLQHGGDILCQAMSGQYTEFIIQFPK